MGVGVSVVPDLPETHHHKRATINKKPKSARTQGHQLLLLVLLGVVLVEGVGGGAGMTAGVTDGWTGVGGGVVDVAPDVDADGVGAGVVEITEF